MKSAAWVMALIAVVGAFGHVTEFTHWPFTGLSVLGGVLFGVGAGLNGGCTFSTLKRLPFPAGELRALIGMNHDFGSGLSPPNGQAG